MCDFCKARKYEIEKGNDVTCQICVIDKEAKEKFVYLLFDLKYCPNCGKELVKWKKKTVWIASIVIWIGFIAVQTKIKYLCAFAKKEMI